MSANAKSRSESGNDGTGSSALRGLFIVAVCSPFKADALTGPLRSLGAEVTVFQAVEIRELASDALDAAIEHLDGYHWVIFTSSYGVHFFARRLLRPIPARVRVCAIGPATAARARDYGLPVDLVPDEFVAEGVARALVQRCGGPAEIAGKRFLLPRAKEARDLIPDEISAAGGLVDVIPCYESVEAPADPGLIQEIVARPPDLLVFTSSSQVANFISIVGEKAAGALLEHAQAAALGPVTARTLETFGKRPEIVPRENTIVSLVGAIRTHYQTKAEQ